MTKALDLSQLASDPKPISVGEEAAENYMQLSVKL
jgi:AraC family transcriptional regulator of adaptative response/methylated-DNA-[protein]-cysteine methyltransferase